MKSDLKDMVQLLERENVVAQFKDDELYFTKKGTEYKLILENGNTLLFQKNKILNNWFLLTSLESAFQSFFYIILMI